MKKDTHIHNAKRSSNARMLRRETKKKEKKKQLLNRFRFVARLDGILPECKSEIHPLNDEIIKHRRTELNRFNCAVDAIDCCDVD